MIDELYAIRTELDRLLEDLHEDNLDEAQMWALADRASRLLEDSKFNPLDESSRIIHALSSVVDKLIREQEMLPPVAAAGPVPDERTPPVDAAPVSDERASGPDEPAAQVDDESTPVTDDESSGELEPAHSDWPF